MKRHFKVTAAAAGTLSLMLVGIGSTGAWAAPPDEHKANGTVAVDDSKIDWAWPQPDITTAEDFDGDGKPDPAWVAKPGTTEDELRALPGYVDEVDGVYYYAHYRWEEQHLDPNEEHQVHEHQYSRVVKVQQDQVKYEIETPYWTVESKQMLMPTNPGQANQMKAWFEKIGAWEVGDGWWQIPDAVIAAVNFNPHTVADTGTVNPNSYGGPNISTIQYRKTQTTTTVDPNSSLAIEQMRQLFWDGAKWVTSQGQAAWMPADAPAPEGSKVFATQSIDTGQTVTYYATQGGGESTDPNDAGWFETKPAGNWNEGTEDHLVPDWAYATDWAKHYEYDESYNNEAWHDGSDAEELYPDVDHHHPALYQGYTDDTQHFRPFVEYWKITLADLPEVDTTDGPPPVVTPEGPEPGTPTEKPTEPNKPAKPAKPAEPAKPAKPVVAEPAKAAAPAPAPTAVPDAIDAGGPLAIEAGGYAQQSGISIPTATALAAGGVLIAGGIAVTYSVMHHKARKP